MIPPDWTHEEVFDLWLLIHSLYKEPPNLHEPNERAAYAALAVQRIRDLDPESVRVLFDMVQWHDVTVHMWERDAMRMCEHGIVILDPAQHQMSGDQLYAFLESLCRSHNNNEGGLDAAPEAP